MSKPLDKAKARLKRRQLGVSPKNGATKLPGSLNRHKAAPQSNGGRSRDQIKAASRAATT